MTMTNVDLLERQLQDLHKDLDRLKLDVQFLRRDINMRERVDMRLKGEIEVLEIRLSSLAARPAPLKV